MHLKKGGVTFPILTDAGNVTPPFFRCIIWGYDIFGFSAGRTRQLCDYFADQENIFTYLYRQIDRWIDRQMDSQIDSCMRGQIDKQIDRKMNIQIDR